jgi:hypothetical protein
MDDFLKAYRAWYRAPFPKGSPRDDLGDVYGDLHLGFEWILSTVEPFAERGTVVPPAGVDIDAGLGDLRSRLVALRTWLTGADADCADEYLAYLDLLEAVYHAYCKVIATR